MGNGRSLFLQNRPLAFYNYLRLVIIIKDFVKGLKAAYIAKAIINLSLTKIIKKALVCLLN